MEVPIIFNARRGDEIFSSTRYITVSPNENYNPM
jgi:hypothetical protein